jgi:tRNA nucleotidyltransferase/poly(A) polymerase
MKIYTDDPKIHYVKTTITPERTRDEISEILRAYDTSDILWHWKLNTNDVFVQFIIEEIIDGVHVKVGAKVVMPTVWDKANHNAHTPERKVESVNLAVSMRIMHWYIKSHMETAYAMQSSRVAAFLPDLVTMNGQRYFDTMKQRLDQYHALEAPVEQQREVEVIKPNCKMPRVLSENITEQYCPTKEEEKAAQAGDAHSERSE